MAEYNEMQSLTLNDAKYDSFPDQTARERIKNLEDFPKNVDLTGYAKTGDIPTKVSQLENDKGYLAEAKNTIPDYWQDAVNTAIAKVKTLQNMGGKDVINFLLFADLHYGDLPAEYTKNIGVLCAAVMDACHIPFAVNCGDTSTSNTAFNTERDFLGTLEGARELLAPIGAERLLQIRGNHDDSWGFHTSGDTTYYYSNKLAPAKIWNVMHRWQANDFRRVFGGDGTYFYVDNTPQKVRFICLNGHYYAGEEITNATGGQMNVCFGAEQLEWLENVALTVDDGWGVLIFTHIPPSDVEVNGISLGLAATADGKDFRSVISNSAADIIAVFCGHYHTDGIITGDLPFPIVITTTAGGVPSNSAEGTRTAGTTTETAIDIVSVNKKTGMIYLTRLGIGTDRAYSYIGEEVVIYTVTNKLTCVANSNIEETIVNGAAYSALLTADSGYELSEVIVTMGGEDVTASVYIEGVITIESVTGDVVITAIATKPDYVLPELNVDLVPTSEAMDSADIYNGMGYQRGYLLAFDDYTGIAQESDVFAVPYDPEISGQSMVVTGYMKYPIVAGSPLKITVDGMVYAPGSHFRVMIASPKNVKKALTAYYNTEMQTYFDVVCDASGATVNNGKFTLTPKDALFEDFGDDPDAYIRICSRCLDESVLSVKLSS